MQPTHIVTSHPVDQASQIAVGPVTLLRAQDFISQTHIIEGNPNLHGLSIVDDYVIWVSGTQGKYSRTINGGTSWTTHTVPGAEDLDFRSLWAFDAHNAILVSAGEAQHGQARIYRTDDGGSKWKLVLNVATEGIFFDGVAFWNQNSGVAICDPQDGFQIMYRTDDGGQNWQRQNLFQATAGEYVFAASNSSLVLKGSDAILFGTGGTASHIFFSPDRGKTWQSTCTPITTIPGDRYSGIHSLAFLSDKVGIAVGGSASNRTGMPGANAVVTTDGGATWQPHMGLSGRYLSGVAWAAPNKAIAVDGSMQNYHAIQAGPSSLWMVGENGLCSRVTV